MSNEKVVVDDLARRAGIGLTDVGRESLVSVLSSIGRIVPGEGVTVQADDGSSRSVSDWFSDQIKASPAFLVPAKPAPAALTGTRTERAIATKAAARADKTARAKALFEEHGNPWQSSRLNRTRQAQIRNSDPLLADRLQAEAAL